MGFGESVGPVEGLTLHDNARDVAVAIEKTSAAPAIIAGWAYGNRVARMLAIDRPELVRGVVLIAAGGKFPPKPEVMTELRAFQDKSLSLEKHCSTRRQCLVTDSGNSYFPAQKAVFGRPCNESGRADRPAGRRRQVCEVSGRGGGRGRGIGIFGWG